MNEFATTTLWITSLVIPALIVFFGGFPRSFGAGLIRAILGIGCGWAVVVAYAQAAQVMSQEPINGAVIAFASVLGWIIPSLTIAFCLLIQWLVLRRIKNKPNKAEMATPRKPSDRFES